MAIDFDCTNISERIGHFPSPKAGPVFITARSLFLNETVSSHFDPKWTPDTAWDYGTYTTNLHIDGATLNGWCGKSVLDVGGGASLFLEEVATTYGIDVTNLDLHIGGRVDQLDDALKLDAAQRQMLGFQAHENVSRKRLIKTLYARNLEWLWCKKKTDIISGPAYPIFEKIFNNRQAIADQFYSDGSKRIVGDATDRGKFSKGRFDVILSVWMMNYLNTDLKKQIIQNMIYWVNTPGEIRICGGNNRAEGSSGDADLTPTSFGSMFSSLAHGGLIFAQYFVYEGRRVVLDPASNSNCLILRCTDVAKDTWSWWGF
jgi:hypothetical protein